MCTIFLKPKIYIDMGTLQIVSFLSFGYDGKIVKVESDLKRGLPCTEIVGLPGGAVKEAKERVRVAIKNAGFEYPPVRILINLCPASEKKDGSGFDLAIALAILANNEQLIPENDVTVLVIGELELSGNLRKVNGVLSAVAACKNVGIRYCIVPSENEAEAMIPHSCEVYGVHSLSESYECLKRIVREHNTCSENLIIAPTLEKNIECITWPDDNSGNKSCDDYSEVRGQADLLDALVIAASGGHNMLVYGPPGCGKSLSLRKFYTLLPDLDFKTSIEVSRIYSIAGLLPEAARDCDILIRQPPFRCPHQNASLEGMIGGAGKCLPGEISLAHGGVLFLDEANQFKVSVLQSLRGPLETGIVTLSRAEKRTTYPARFQLLMAMNPCDCGNLGNPNAFCTCSPLDIDKYWKRLTAPLIDRIDMRLFVLPPTPQSLLEQQEISTASMRAKIKKVYEIQWDRNTFLLNQSDGTKLSRRITEIKNAHITGQALTSLCSMTADARRAFNATGLKEQISGRSSHAILKLARTIADLESSEKIQSAHIEKAISLRTFNPLLPEFLC